MSANVTPLQIGPLDAERSELLLRVVEGLEPSSLQWLSGFAAGVAFERANGRGFATAIPAASPPPPMGTTSVSMLGLAPSISSATVPCPAMTSGSSKG